MVHGSKGSGRSAPVVGAGARVRACSRAVVRARVLASLLALAAGLAPSLAAQEPRAVGVRGPLTLEEAVRMALERNRDVRDARLALESAEERVGEAWASVFPSVDLSASFTRSLTVPKTFIPAIIFDPDAAPDELIGVQFGADNSWSTQIRVEQPLFQAGAFIGVGAAARYEALQREMLRGRQHGVVTRVRIAYYDVLLAQERVRLTENTVRRVRETLEETQALNRAGLASDYDVLRLQVELGNVEPELRRAQNRVLQARRALAVELGLDALDSLEVEGSLAEMHVGRVADNDAAGGNGGVLRFTGLADPEAMAADEVVALALERRSDLRQLELMERLRHTELRLEQAEYLPKVSLFGIYLINAQENGSPDFFGESARQRSYGRQVGVQVTLPLFSGFKRPARIGQKKAALAQAETQLRFAADQAEHQVRTLLEQVEEARRRADAQRLAVAQAQRGFEIASAQYREGLGSQLEVTDAEVALRQSEFNYAESVYEYLVARARLDEAVGTVPLVDVGAGLALRSGAQRGGVRTAAHD